MKSAIAIAAASAALANAAATPVQVAARAETSSGSVPQVTVKGNAFWAGDKRFYIRGVDYQPGGASDAKDPIADVDGCKRDVEEFKKLGINTVRVYTVDNTADHDECMGLLADAGIYLALDVNTPKYSINRGDPAPSYNKVYLQSLFATVDAFANYDNTLLFFSGNEVINDDKTSNCAPYVKAVTRDLRQYIGSRGYRKIPVGYSAADVESNRFEMAQYMNCGTDDQRSDFYAFNDYSWCDPSSFAQSGWDQKVKQYGNYSIPLFLSEYGCNKNKRTFNAVKGLYGDKMTKAYSGGLVYEYTVEGDKNYGLVTISGNKVEEEDDFAALKKAYKDTPIPTTDGNYNKDGKPSECPKKSKHWNVDMADDTLPSTPSGVDEYFKNGAGKGKGLTGGSQEAGSDKAATGPAASGAITSGATASSSGSSPATSGSTDKSAASSVSTAPFAGFVMLVASVFGAALL